MVIVFSVVMCSFKHVFIIKDYSEDNGIGFEIIQPFLGLTMGQWLASLILGAGHPMGCRFDSALKWIDLV